MKKNIAILLCLVMIMSVFAGCSPAGGGGGDTITVTDHTGAEVTVPKNIERIVVADIYPLPSILTVFLGSADKIVGIHPMSMNAAKSGTLSELFPEILNAETGFINGTDLNMEELLLLEPDIVFYSADNNKVGEALKNAGIPAVGISAGNWDYDILETYNQWISLLGQIFPDNDKSDQVAAYSKEMYDMVQERLGMLSVKEYPSAFFLFQYDDSRILTSGKNFFGQFWCEAINCKNVSEEIDISANNAIVNMEQIYKWAPEVIFITNFTTAQPEDLYNNTIGNYDWSEIPAVKNKRVYKMPLGTYRSYTPSADTPIVLLWLAKQAHPELFADIDMTKEVKDYYSEIYGVELTDAQVTKMFNPSSSAAVEL